LTPLPLFSLLKKSGKTKIAKISQNKVNIVRGAMARLRSEVFFAIAKSKIYTRCSNFAEDKKVSKGFAFILHKGAQLSLQLEVKNRQKLVQESPLPQLDSPIPISTKANLRH
jgi:hypothetical protein